MEKINKNTLFENKEDERNFVSYVLSDLIPNEKNVVEISEYADGDFIIEFKVYDDKGEYLYEIDVYRETTKKFRFLKKQTYFLKFLISEDKGFDMMRQDLNFVVDITKKDFDDIYKAIETKLDNKRLQFITDRFLGYTRNKKLENLT